MDICRHISILFATISPDIAFTLPLYFLPLEKQTKKISSYLLSAGWWHQFLHSKQKKCKVPRKRALSSRLLLRRKAGLIQDSWCAWISHRKKQKQIPKSHMVNVSHSKGHHGEIKTLCHNHQDSIVCDKDIYISIYICYIINYYYFPAMTLHYIQSEP